jgi:tetratricopeptide (TPR) repeat protein
MTQLPIGRDTLSVGSSDGGQTIANRSSGLFEKMQRLGTSLNLKGHWVGCQEAGGQYLHTPVDLEGHVSGGQMYLCDFSRLMPPEKPAAGNKQSYLYELLRREYVLLVDRPLSSDAFSRFTKQFPGHKADNREVEQATLHLRSAVIPAVAAELESVLQVKSDYAVTQFRMSSMLHSNGVNVRHLFRIFEHLRGKTARALVLVEMVTRVLVQDTRRKLRDTTRRLPVSMVEGYYLQVLAERFNLVFGNSPRSTMYWNKYVRKQLWRKFCRHLGPAITPELAAQFPMFSRSVSFKAASMGYVFSNGMVSLHVVFARMQQILGFSLKPAIDAQLLNFAVFVRLCGKPSPFRFSDFDDLGMRVKHMNLVSYAKGFLYLSQGLDARASDPKAASRFLQMSIKNFEDALADNTSSKVTLRACAKALFYYDEETRRAQFQKRGRQSASGDESSSGVSQYLARADLYFRRAILADPGDAESLWLFAAFLDRTGNKPAAEECYKRALKADPHHVEALKGYGDFLSDQVRPLHELFCCCVAHTCQGPVSRERDAVPSRQRGLASKGHRRVKMKALGASLL